MSGLLTFSDGTTWMVSNRVWRRLMARAAEDASAPPAAEALHTGLYASGLAFPDLPASDHPHVTAALTTSATALLSHYRTEGPEAAADAAKLADLLRLLATESRSGGG